MPVILHAQDIVENARRLCAAKYFVKIDGRALRGNGVLEVVSAGTLILARRGLVHFHELVHPLGFVQSLDQLLERIRYFETHEDEYLAAVAWQRAAMTELYIQRPLEQLYAHYLQKLAKDT